MKNLINLSFAALLILSTSAFASTKTASNKLAAADTALDLYVETIAMGQTQYADELFSEQFHQSTNTPMKAIRHNKQDVVNFLKGQKNIKQNCSTTYDIIETGASYTLARVEMKYEGFSKVDFVTLHNENGSWKVNHVVSTYQ